MAYIPVITGKELRASSLLANLKLVSIEANSLWNRELDINDYHLVEIKTKLDAYLIQIKLAAEVYYRQYGPNAVNLVKTALESVEEINTALTEYIANLESEKWVTRRGKYVKKIRQSWVKLNDSIIKLESAVPEIVQIKEKGEPILTNWTFEKDSKKRINLTALNGSLEEFRRNVNKLAKNGIQKSSLQEHKIFLLTSFDLYKATEYVLKLNTVPENLREKLLAINQNIGEICSEIDTYVNEAEAGKRTRALVKRTNAKIIIGLKEFEKAFDSKIVTGSIPIEGDRPEEVAEQRETPGPAPKERPKVEELEPEPAERRATQRKTTQTPGSIVPSIPIPEMTNEFCKRGAIAANNLAGSVAEGLTKNEFGNIKHRIFLMLQTFLDKYRGTYKIKYGVDSQLTIIYSSGSELLQNLSEFTDSVGQGVLVRQWVYRIVFPKLEAINRLDSNPTPLTAEERAEQPREVSEEEIAREAEKKPGRGRGFFEGIKGWFKKETVPPAERAARPVRPGNLARNPYLLSLAYELVSSRDDRDFLNKNELILAIDEIQKWQNDFDARDLSRLQTEYFDTINFQLNTFYFLLNRISDRYEPVSDTLEGIETAVSRIWHSVDDLKVNNVEFRRRNQTDRKRNIQLAVERLMQLKTELEGIEQDYFEIRPEAAPGEATRARPAPEPRAERAKPGPSPRPETAKPATAPTITNFEMVAERLIPLVRAKIGDVRRYVQNRERKPADTIPIKRNLMQLLVDLNASGRIISDKIAAIRNVKNSAAVDKLRPRIINTLRDLYDDVRQILTEMQNQSINLRKVNGFAQLALRENADFELQINTLQRVSQPREPEEAAHLGGQTQLMREADELTEPLPVSREVRARFKSPLTVEKYFLGIKKNFAKLQKKIKPLTEIADLLNLTREKKLEEELDNLIYLRDELYLLLENLSAELEINSGDADAKQKFTTVLIALKAALLAFDKKNILINRDDLQSISTNLKLLQKEYSTLNLEPKIDAAITAAKNL